MRRLLGCTALTLGLIGLVGTGATGLGQAHAKQPATMLYFADSKHGDDYRTLLYRANPSSPSKRVKLRVPPHTFLIGATLSPDGEQIAELLDRYTNGPRSNQIEIVDRDGRHPRAVMGRKYSPAFYTTPVWSPDSSTLYFSRESNGDPQHDATELLSVSALRNNPRIIPVQGGAMLQDPAVSPDGKRLAAVEITDDDHCCYTTSSLLTVTLATGKQSGALLTSARAPFVMDQPAWSPDGRRIAIVSYNYLGTQDNRTSVIDVVAADGSDAGTPTIAADGGSQFYVAGPAWRNAHQLWFSRNFKAEGSTDIEKHSTPADLFSVNLTPDGFSAPHRQTHTKHLSEHSLSFSR